MMRAALGLRVHSGWAALVALGEGSAGPGVVERRRIELVDGRVQGAAQPYHEAEGLDLAAAARLLKRHQESARLRACDGLQEMSDSLRRRGLEIGGCGILLSSGRTGLPLHVILSSHALIHTADGDHFREALAYASKQCGIPVAGVRERELLERAGAVLRLPADEIRRLLSDMGKGLGPPWTQDQKYAALVAWLVLAETGRAGARARAKAKTKSS